MKNEHCHSICPDDCIDHDWSYTVCDRCIKPPDRCKCAQEKEECEICAVERPINEIEVVGMMRVCHSCFPKSQVNEEIVQEALDHLASLEKNEKAKEICECPIDAQYSFQMCYNCKGQLEMIYQAQDNKDLGDHYEEQKIAIYERKVA